MHYSDNCKVFWDKNIKKASRWGSLFVSLLVVASWFGELTLVLVFPLRIVSVALRDP
jgi:hypothetical protein